MTRDGYTREEAETVYWLTYEAHAPAVDSQPTGGIYKNVLHGFSFSVKTGDY